MAVWSTDINVASGYNTYHRHPHFLMIKFWRRTNYLLAGLPPPAVFRHRKIHSTDQSYRPLHPTHGQPFLTTSLDSVSLGTAHTSHKNSTVTTRLHFLIYNFRGRLLLYMVLASNTSTNLSGESLLELKACPLLERFGYLYQKTIDDTENKGTKHPSKKGKHKNQQLGLS